MSVSNHPIIVVSSLAAAPHRLSGILAIPSIISDINHTVHNGVMRCQLKYNIKQLNSALCVTRPLRLSSISILDSAAAPGGPGRAGGC